MSKTTDVYNALKARIVAVLDTKYTQISNVNNLEMNGENQLRLGYGVKFDGGDNTQRMIPKKLSVDRDFTVILTRKLFTTNSGATQTEAATLDLMEDQKLILDDIEIDHKLASTAVLQARYTSDTGVDSIEDSENFLKIETTIRIEYLDDLN